MPRIIAITAAALLVIGIYTRVSADPPTSPVENKIRDARGTAPGLETGDPMLDDILNVIKGRGSILDGSVLQEPQSEHSDAIPRPTNSAAKAGAAEQLLKASRLLENLGSPDKTRATLIKRMRGEAGKLLAE